MKDLMLKALLVVGSLFVFSFSCLAPVHASSSGILDTACDKYLKQGNLPGCTKDANGVQESLEGQKYGLAHRVVDTLLYAAGIISFLFLIIGGIQYLTSTGDAGRIQRAKDTVLYAIIGLIVTILAVPIAGFVIQKLGG